jgi:uncharacterized membrane protein SpoIIM required for sporulation
MGRWFDGLPPFSRENDRLAIFTAVFLILVGIVMGLVVADADTSMIGAARSQYDRSVVNVAYTTVEAGVQAHDIPIWIALAAYIGVILVNNLLVMGLAAYAYRFLALPTAVLMSSYLLVASGFIPAIIGMQVATKYGALLALAAIAPHGCVEMIGLATAGALGLLAATHGSSDAVNAAVSTRFHRAVIPLIVVAAVVEIIITPVIVLLVL